MRAAVKVSQYVPAALAAGRRWSPVRPHSRVSVSWTDNRLVVRAGARVLRFSRTLREGSA